MRRRMACESRLSPWRWLENAARVACLLLSRVRPFDAGPENAVGSSRSGLAGREPEDTESFQAWKSNS